MPVYLKEYEGCATKQNQKFVRAVKCFIEQSYKDSELVIVSDGCDATEQIYNAKFSSYENIRLVKIEKQLLFSGNVRQAGLNVAKGDIITYLDADDIIKPHHLKAIANSINDNTWIYYNDWVFNGYDERLRIVTLTQGSAGTSCIAHVNKKDINWTNCDGYGHDWMFIKRLMFNTIDNKNFEKVEGMGYVVMHIATFNFDF